MLCLTACTPAIKLQPSHPVEVTHYVDKPISPALLQTAKPCDVQRGATWSDVWDAYLCERNGRAQDNCNLDAIAKRPLKSDCKPTPPDS